MLGYTEDCTKLANAFATEFRSSIRNYFGRKSILSTDVFEKHVDTSLSSMVFGGDGDQIFGKRVHKGNHAGFSGIRCREAGRPYVEMYSLPSIDGRGSFLKRLLGMARRGLVLEALRTSSDVVGYILGHTGPPESLGNILYSGRNSAMTSGINIMRVLDYQVSEGFGDT